MTHLARRPVRVFVIALALIVCAGVFALGQAALARATANPPPGATGEQAIRAALALARERGTYRFDGDVTQVTLPSATVINIGRTSWSDAFHVEGKADLRSAGLDMRLWSGDGSVAQDETAIGVKVENGKTFIRQGAGEWKQDGSFSTDGLAPQGDFLAFLKAVRDVQPGVRETRAGIAFTRYAFQVDGPAFADWARDGMEAAMLRKGELAPGTRLTAPAYYRDMTGEGELWVRDDGLPLRQVLTLRFPEQRDESVQAQIKITFSEFAPAPANPFMATIARIGDALPNVQFMLLVLASLVLIGLLMRFHASRRVQRAVAVVIISVLVSSAPLDGLRQLSILNTRIANAAGQEKARTEADALRELRRLDAKQPFNPHASPLAAAEQRAAAVSSSSLTAAVTNAPTAQTSPTDTGTDSDGDGLTDFAEVRVGTFTNTVDTDDDGVPDGVEVRGFSLGGKTWYLNADALDSNDDGIPDGDECWRTPPAASTPVNAVPGCDLDTDGDGTPDVFDADNDNDGVPDRLDLSPFTASAAAYNDASPLKLTLNNLAANTPVFVDFQIRPSNAQHLWYAFNVLDWPRDSAGQITDVDGKTWADYAAAQGRMPAANESFGDLKLVPMLEIRITGATTNLPPQSDLTPYNISVNNYTADGSTKIAYVPLTLINDEKTGQRVAFGARMRYLPSGSWPAPHDVRLAWAVQMLVDAPCDPDAANAAQIGCASDGYIHNQPQVIQTYYESWRLAGLNVSEDHGAKTALIYEDPAVDPNLKEDAALAGLSLGLDNSFLAGRDADNNNARDVDIDEIARRFDRAGNSGVSATQRWGLDGAQNILNVERRDYPLFDQATIFTAMTETTRILDSKFNSAWTADNTVIPTILFAYERVVRPLGLESGTGYVTSSGNALTLDMQTGTSRAALNTIAGAKWAHYCRAAANASWTVCDGEVYWNTLNARLGTGQLPNTPNDPDSNAGNRFFALIYDVLWSQGTNRVVQSDSQLVSSRYTLLSDSDAEAAARGAFNASGLSIAAIANYVYIQSFDQVDFARRIYGKILTAVPKGTETTPQLVRQARGLFNKNRLLGTGGAFTFVAVIGAGLALAAYYDSQGKREVGTSLRSVVIALQVVVNIVAPILTVKAWATALQGAATTAKILQGKAELLGNSQKANAIGAAIAITVTWGFFIYSMVSNKVSAFSPEFNKALAETIATTIYIIVLTVLAATVVGAIIVGIVGAIDAILTAVCEAGVSDLRTVPGLGGACFTLGTTAIKGIAYFLYNYDLMIDTNRSDMVQTGGPTTRLADPSKGFVAGNEISITLPLTTLAVHKSPDAANGLYINLYLWLFSKDNLRSSTYKYTVTRPNKEDINVSRGQMTGAWQDVREDRKYVRTPMYRGTAATTLGPISNFQLQPGINRPADFYLNMGYALPAYECFAIPVIFFYPVPVCYTRTFNGKTSTKIEALKYDILPNTLDGFMTVSNRRGGTGLAWDNAFPTLFDGDGDGLIASNHGGIDPDDTTWDADNDGLSDAFELNGRANGVAYSPIQCDTDNDGLTDAQEAFFGTNPAIADTDNDGLKDGDEVWHQVYDPNTCQPTGAWVGGWDVTINAQTPFTVHVSSDPTRADGDGDGVSDLAEKQLAANPDPAKRVDSNNAPYHPNVANMPPVAVFVDADQRYVRPGQTFPVTTTVVANVPMAPGVLDVTPPSAWSGPLAPVPLPFNPLTFSGTQSATQETTLTAVGGSSGQSVAISSSVRARLAPTGSSNLTWDPFVFNSLGNKPQRYALTALAASAPDRQDTYLAATVSTSDVITRDGNGAVVLDAIPSGQQTTLYSSGTTGFPFFSTSQMGNNEPDIACNNAGRCLTVWDQHQIALFVGHVDGVRGSLRGSNGEAITTINPNAGFGDSITASGFNPQVATDGTNFLVAYEFTPITSTVTKQTYMRWVLYSPSGTELNREQSQIESNRAWPQYTAGVGLDVAWIGSRYRIVWKFIRQTATSVYQQLNVGDVDANGNLVLPFQYYVESELPNDKRGTPKIAYDPVGDYVLIIYKWPNTDVNHILTRGVNLFPVLRSGRIGSASSTGFGFNVATQDPPHLAYHPGVNGFLVSAGGRLHLMTTDLSNRYLTDYNTVRNNSDVPIACPMLKSQPVGDYRFEEAPGATTFVNSATLSGADATCSGGNCPTAGYPGATDSGGLAAGTPASDYAIRFDGAGDTLSLNNRLGSEFSVAFWYKAAPQSGFATNFGISSNGSGGFTMNVATGSSPIEFLSGSARAASTTSLLDDQWHQVVATRSSNGNLAVYLDGNPTPIATATGSGTPGMGSTIDIGGNTPGVHFDNLQLYNTALVSSTVEALYQRETQSYCVGGHNDEGYEWTKLNVYRPDNRGGKIVASGSLSLTVDADAPTSTIIGLSDYQVVQGNQTLIIGGDANDPTSSVAGVEVSVNGAGLQPANGAATWSYPLTVGEGTYLIQTRATDIAGNAETPGPGLTVVGDATAPTVAINALSTTPLTPTRDANGIWSVALSGTASDGAPVGIPRSAGLDPATVQVRLQGRDGVSIGNGWQTVALNASAWTISYTFPPGLTDPTGVYTVSVRAADAVGNATSDDGATAVLRLDATGPEAALSEADSARQIITETLTLSGTITETGLAGLDALEIAFTPIEQVAALPSDATSDQAEALLNRAWTPATLAQRGASATQSTWTVQVPAGLENEYQIDLRGTDLLGNRLITSGVWRGVIDTLAPRVTFTATPTGATFRQKGVRRYAVSFTCAATDRYLNDVSFQCPGNAIRPPMRIFSTTPAMQALFPDRTIQSALVNTYTLWLTTTTPVATTSACDDAGRCTSANTGAQASADRSELLASITSDVRAVPASQAALSLPMAVVIAPTDGSYVGSATGAISVTVAAESDQSLREVVITLDGNVAATISFAQADAITETQRTVSIAVPGGAQGLHIVSARAIDWAGTSQSQEFPVAFTLDTQPPAVTLDNDPLTISDTWQLGSDVLRFRGTASDSAGLAAVQIKVNDLPFTDAAFANGTWQTALPVVDPEGKTLSVTVRALDYAGQTSQVAASIGTQLSAPEAPPPDTSITSGPANPSAVNTATVVFTGTSTTSEVVAFECSLDDAAFAPCASPYELSGLSNGSRTLRVRAVDANGSVDLSPASVTWTVDVPTLRSTLTAAPSNPSTRREDGFTFTGEAGTTGFECSLDGAAFAPCASPVFYSGLSYSEHVFLVRARDANGNIGAPTRYEWTVVNTAPAVEGQAVSTLEDTPVAITLVATDTDALTWKLGPPARGVLQGVPPNLTYTPDTGFSSTDSFTFSVNDGLVESVVATVVITVRPRDNTPPTSTITLNPTAPTGLNGWYVGPVRAVVTATDGTDPKATGVADTRCVLNPATAPNTFAQIAAGCAYTGAGADITGDRVHTLFAASRDGAGNAEAPISQTVRLDTTPPAIAVTGVASNAIYPLGAIPAAGCSTTDATSGVAVSSTVGVSGGNTHGVGRFTTACSSATDVAGNTRPGISAPYTVTYNVNRFVMLAQEGVSIEQFSVVTGSLAARIVSPGPFLANNAELSLAQDVNVISPTNFVLGDSLYLAPRARVPNPGYNTLTNVNNAAVLSGATATPFTPTLVPALPALPTITPGTTAVNVAQYARATIGAGSYGALTANQFSVITFTGGVYQFASWSIAQYVKLNFSAPTEIRIASRLAVDQFAEIGPAPTTPSVRARDIVIFVGGQNGSTGALSATPKAAAFSQYVKFAANVVAPNGTAQFLQRATITGALFGRWVQIGQYSTLNLDARFASTVGGGTTTTTSGMSAMSALIDEGAAGADGAGAAPAAQTSLTPPNALFLPLLAQGETDGATIVVVGPPSSDASSAGAPVDVAPAVSTEPGDVIIEPGDIPADAPPLLPPPDPNAPDGDDADADVPTAEPTSTPMLGPTPEPAVIPADPLPAAESTATAVQESPPTPEALPIEPTAPASP
jgi:hypothetical protein